MPKPATIAAVAALAAPTSFAAADTVPTDPKRCEALAAEAAGLRAQLGQVRAKKTVGFLAGVASRALVYAPGIDLGDGTLQRSASQAVESELHEQAATGLGKAQDGARRASFEKPEARLKEIRVEARKLDCPKA